jgi:flagellar FliJ protein
MPAAFPLQSLLDHARHRMEAAERMLLMIKRKEDAARQRMDELETYQREYRERFAGSSQGGMPIQILRDYHHFLGKLEVAIRGQQNEVEQFRRRWQSAHETWMDLRRKVKSYEVLANRHQTAETRRQDRREQGQSDELSGRQAAVGRTHEP